MPVDIDMSFLDEWLSEYESFKAEDEQLKLSAKERERFAVQAGFRDFETARKCMHHKGMLLKRFRQERAFHQLWRELAICDAHQPEEKGFAFSAANGGFPASLLREVEWWYQAPKLTQGEKQALSKKMLRACGELLDGLSQLSPAGPTNESMSIGPLEAWQVEVLYQGLSTKERYDNRPSVRFQHGWMEGAHESYVLNDAGITPLFVIERLRSHLTRLGDGAGRLPRKIRAHGAMKTQFIEVFDRRLSDATVFSSHQPKLEVKLVAELVSLIVDADCSVDDVIKARAANRANEKRRAEDFARELKKSSIEK